MNIQGDREGYEILKASPESYPNLSEKELRRYKEIFYMSVIYLS